MRYPRRYSVSTRWRARVLPLCAALALGCHGEVGDTGTWTTHDAASAIRAKRAGGRVAADHAAHEHADHQHGRSWFRPEEAKAVVARRFRGDDGVPGPLPAREVRDAQEHSGLQRPGLIDLLAHHVGNYVRDHFAAVTKCGRPGRTPARSPGSNKLAAKAYRRPLSQGELDRFTGQSGLYYTLKSQIVNGCQVTTERRGSHRQLACTGCS